MTPAEIIYHRRVRVLDAAAKTDVAKACRVFGCLKDGLLSMEKVAGTYARAALIPKTKRPPAMRNATPSWVVEELLAEAVVRPTLGAAPYAEHLEARAFVISASGAQKVLNRSGLGRGRKRLNALAQLTTEPTGLVAEAALEGPFGFCYFAAWPGDLVPWTASSSANSKASERSRLRSAAGEVPAPRPCRVC